MPEINHCKGVISTFVETNRLRMHVLTAGNPEHPPILFLHGNTSAATIWEEFMLRLSGDFYCIAPDLRGFGLTDDTKRIDATRGSGDWVDDVTALADVLQLDRFHLAGHSLGGFVCWGLIAACPARLQSVTLFAPGPPMGFGGIKGSKGIANNEAYSGSGAGIVVDDFAERIKAGDRSTEAPFYSPRNAMNRLFWKEGFKAGREEEILSAMLQIHTGDKQYPGDFTASEYWPGVAPGKWGPVNALSPKYNEDITDKVIAAEPKPPLLWVQGADDNIIAELSYSDPGYQGKLGLRAEWPGAEVYPPQPMVSQLEYVLEAYEQQGGRVTSERIEDCGHTAFLEKPRQAERLMRRHLENR